MQMVIEISSYDKEWITNGYYIPEEINMRISEAIANGIPLPKGHGKLIDADSLVQEHPLAFVRDVINESEIIVEADTESEDKDNEVDN